MVAEELCNKTCIKIEPVTVLENQVLRDILMFLPIKHILVLTLYYTNLKDTF